MAILNRWLELRALNSARSLTARLVVSRVCHCAGEIAAIYAGGQLPAQTGLKTSLVESLKCRRRSQRPMAPAEVNSSRRPRRGGVKPFLRTAPKSKLGITTRNRKMCETVRKQ